MRKYFIKKLTYYDEYGIAKSSHYRICYKTKFLFLFDKIEYVKHLINEWGDSYKVVTEFNTVNDAKNFIKNTLCGNIKKDYWNEETVDVLDCNDLK